MESFSPLAPCVHACLYTHWLCCQLQSSWSSCSLAVQKITSTFSAGRTVLMCFRSACACFQPAAVRWASSFTMPILWKPSPCRTKWMTCTIGLSQGEH